MEDEGAEPEPKVGRGLGLGGAGPELGSTQQHLCLPPQHLYIWLVSEKAHERQRAVHTCTALLKFLSHNHYLDVSTWLAGPRPHNPLLSQPRPLLSEPARVHKAQAPGPATRIGCTPECPAPSQVTPFLHRRKQPRGGD